MNYIANYYNVAYSGQNAHSSVRYGHHLMAASTLVPGNIVVIQHDLG